MNKKAVFDNIMYDVDRGIYDQFPKLRQKLLFIADKVQRSIYVVNSAPLTVHELEVLTENEYI